jgi:uncharacterized protein (DUF1499 family)
MPPRRRFAEEPTSRLAVWARRLAVFSLPVALLAIIIERAGMFEIVPVLATFGAALLLAALAILLAFAAFVVIWRKGVDGIGHAVMAILIGLALLAYPTYIGIKGYGLPPISDITTDPIDPPRFEAIARLRSRSANPATYAGLYAAELQKTAYPDIEPLAVPIPPPAAFEAVRGLIVKRRWQIISERAPQPGRRDGTIEAVARTPVMGFRDDVVVRIRGASQGSRIDARSSSRYGRYDFGANAARLRALLDDIDDVAVVDKTEKPVRAVKAAPGAKGAQPAKR